MPCHEDVHHNRSSAMMLQKRLNPLMVPGFWVKVSPVFPVNAKSVILQQAAACVSWGCLAKPSAWSDAVQVLWGA